MSITQWEKLVLLTAIIGIIMIPVSCIVTKQTEETVTITVTGKERVVKEDSSKYLIFTESETFENTDTIIYWKHNYKQSEVVMA